MTIDSFFVKYDPCYPYFGIISGPIDHPQHPNQKGGLDLYINVINFDTSEKCFKKLYKNSKGLHFKHTGYSPMYLEDFTETVEVVPFQVIFPPSPYAEIQEPQSFLPEDLRKELIDKWSSCKKHNWVAAISTFGADQGFYCSACGASPKA